MAVWQKLGLVKCTAASIGVHVHLIRQSTVMMLLKLTASQNQPYPLTAQFCFDVLLSRVRYVGDSSLGFTSYSTSWLVLYCCSTKLQAW